MSGDIEVVRKALHERHYVCCEHNRSYPCNCGLGLALAALSRLEAQQSKPRKPECVECAFDATSELDGVPLCDGCRKERERGGEQPTHPECPNVARLFQLISGGIGLMNHSEAQQTVLRWWNAVRPELEKSVAPCSPCPTCADLKRERFHQAALSEFLTLERDALTRKVEKLVEAHERIMVGGNHLASALINMLGASERQFPPYSATTDQMRAVIANPDMQDLWICWSIIMQVRDSLVEHEKEQG